MSKHPITLQCLGATRTVTGSKYLITVDNQKILIDCGLFQGLKKLRQRNWLPLPVKAEAIDHVILTHAHIDHSGYVPLLIKNGYSGKIYCSNATLSLCELLLPDSGFLQEELAERANKYGFSKHSPALPLYTKEDAELSLGSLHPVPFQQTIHLNPFVSFKLFPAGHILGAAMVELTIHGKKILFSGDMGRPDDPIMYPPHQLYDCHTLVLESTYGDRLHHQANPLDDIEKVINETHARGGIILIPTFAVGRAQVILYYLYQLKKAGRIPEIPFFIDSPMTTDATQLFYQYANLHKLSKAEAGKVCASATYIKSADESYALANKSGPMIILSASGMATGGRILNHITTFAPNEKNTILFVGYQAEGTRGRKMIAGEKTIKIYGQQVPINAQVIHLDSLSAHADYEQLLDWLANFNQLPHKIILTHGESQSAEAFKQKIEERFTIPCYIPDYLELIAL